MYTPRTYRDWMKADDLVSFTVTERETDLAIMALRDLAPQARASVLSHRGELEGYMGAHPAFRSALAPVAVSGDAPAIVAAMAAASGAAGVGPMAAVAGAMSDFVGADLLRLSPEVIVENGGDIFIRTARPRRIGIYAGDHSPFTGRLGVEIGPRAAGIGVCTSSGTVSHSLSFGRSDAVLIVAESAALADAVATAVGNIVKGVDDIPAALDAGRRLAGVIGLVVMIGDKMGSWGKITLV